MKHQCKKYFISFQNKNSTGRSDRIIEDLLTLIAASPVFPTIGRKVEPSLNIEIKKG